MEFDVPPSSPDPELFNADDDPRRHIDIVASQNMVGSDVVIQASHNVCFPHQQKNQQALRQRKRSSVVAERWKKR
jgi:hypothetical protein